MIKKILNFLFVLILLVFSSNKVFSDCSINSSPKYINDYIKNIYKAYYNINNNLGDGEAESAADDYFAYINSLFSWTYNEISFNFVKNIEKHEEQKQVAREIKRLVQLQSIIKLNYPKKGYNLISKEQLCDGIPSEDCNFADKKYKAGEAIQYLKKSVNELISLLRTKTTGISYIQKNKIYLLSDENLEKLNEDYSSTNLALCNLGEDNSGEKGFFGRALDSIKNINILKNDNKDALEEWREALRLLHGTSQKSIETKKEYSDMEATIQDEGIGGFFGTSKLKNYIEYNGNGEDSSLGKEGYLNVLIRVNDNFKDTLNKLFPEVEDEDSEEKIIQKLGKVGDHYVKIVENQKVLMQINSEYKKLKDFSMQENIEKDNLINRLVKMHLNLNSAINEAKKTCPISVKVCNSQLIGIGECGSCN